MKDKDRSIRVTPTAYKKLVDYKKKSGISIKWIIERMILNGIKLS